MTKSPYCPERNCATVCVSERGCWKFSGPAVETPDIPKKRKKRVKK